MLLRLTNHPAFWFCAVLTWGLTLFILSSRSDLPQGPALPNQDKVIHAVYFMAGAFCFFRTLRTLPRPPTKAWVFFATVVFAGAGGLLDEWHQSFTPGRSGNDMGDVTADVVGGFLGAAIGWMTDHLGRAKMPKFR